MSKVLAWFRQYMAHCFSVLAILVAGTGAIRTLGMGAGPQYANGKQFVGQYTTLDNQVQENIAVSASTPTVVYTMPTPINGEMHEYAVTVNLQCSYADAATNIDGGTCSYTWDRKAIGQYVGGAFCAQNPAGGAPVCASSSATSIDFSLDPTSMAPASPLNGATAVLAWSGSALEVVVTSPVAGKVAFWDTGFHEKNPIAAVPGVDAGVDASDSGTDAADASDSGGGGGDAGLIASVIPNIGSAQGGETIEADFEYSAVSSVSAVTVGGASATSVTFHASSGCIGTAPCVTWTSPAYSTFNGSGSTLSPVVITSNVGIFTTPTSGAGAAQQSFLYLPDPNDAGAVLTSYGLGDPGLGFAPSQWTDRLATNSPVQATGGDQPSACTNFNSVGLGCAQFNGTTDFQAVNLATTVGSAVTMCTVAQFTATTGTNPAIFSLSSSASSEGAYLYAPSGTTFQGVTNGSPSGSLAGSDTNPHVFCLSMNGAATNSYVSVDSSEYNFITGLVSNGYTNVALAALYHASTASNWSASKIAAWVYYNGPLADATTYKNLKDSLATRYGLTPP